MSRTAGITLLELLVVVAIVSILAVTASLGFGRQPGIARANSDAAVLVRAHRAAWFDAVLEGQDIALVIAPREILRERRVGDAWELEGVTYPLRDTLIVVPGPGTLRLETAGAWRLITLASGRGSAAEIQIGSARGMSLCRTNGQAPLSCDTSQ